YMAAWRSVMFESAHTHARLRLDEHEKQDVEIPRITDRLFIVLPDRRKLEAPLEAGQADQIKEKADQLPNQRSILVTLEESLGEHDPRVTDILRHAQQELARFQSTTSPATRGMSSATNRVFRYELRTVQVSL